MTGKLDDLFTDAELPLGHPEPRCPQIQRECKSEVPEPATAEGEEWGLSV